MHKITLFLLSLLLLVGCKTDPNRAHKLLHESDVPFVADNGFQPIVNELAQLYSLRNIEAVMLPHYVNEDSALRMLLRDSVRLAILTRDLNDKEKEIVRANGLKLLQHRIAYDAFALIVHKDNPDTAINVQEIRDIMSGKITRWEQLEMGTKRGNLSVVFDESGSSTVRYMKDSLNGGKPLKGNIYAQGSNQAVIDMVRSNPDVIGVVSTDWVRVAKGDSTAMSSFRELDFKVMLVGKIGKKAADWERPYQYYIATGEYPLVRSVWAIATDPRSRSAIRSFYFMLKDNVGQRVIVNSSQLLPRNQVQVRDVNIK